MRTLIGFDFSINKPFASVLHNNELHFYGWPYNPNKKHLDIFKNSSVNIINRTDNKDKGDNVSSKMRYEVRNARYISEVITDTLKPFLNGNTYIAYEGVSYGSSGDVVLQLGGYKYMLMNELSKYTPLENMYTYSPITIKKTAGCSKRGLTKKDVIESFILNARPNKFQAALRNNKDMFMKKGNKNFIDGVDDIVDSYFVLETLLNNEDLY